MRAQARIGQYTQHARCGLGSRLLLSCTRRHICWTRCSANARRPVAATVRARCTSAPALAPVFKRDRPVHLPKHAIDQLFLARITITFGLRFGLIAGTIFISAGKFLRPCSVIRGHPWKRKIIDTEIHRRLRL